MNDQTDPPPDAGPDADAGTSAQGVATAAPPRPRPVLRRTTGDKVLGGVAGGLARTLDVDAVVVRIGVVVLAVVLPPTLVVYLAAWLLVARDDEPARPPIAGIALRTEGGLGFWVGVVVLVVAALTVLGEPFGAGIDLLPLVLVGIGIALWTRDGSGSRPAATAWPTTDHAGATGTPPPSTTGATMSTTTSLQPRPGDAPPPDVPVAATRPLPAGPPPPPPPPRSPLGAITIGVALIAVGVVAALDQVDSLPLDASASHLAAVALLVLGLGQLVGALWGRARWLTLVAIFLLPPVVAGAVFREVDAAWDLDATEFSVGDGFGERVLTPTPGAPLPDDVRLAAGSVRIDLTDWSPDDLATLDGPEDLTVDVGAGEVILLLPTDVPWRVDGEVRLGELLVQHPVDGVTRQGTEDVGDALRTDLTGGPQGGPVLDIRVDVRLGQLSVFVPDPVQELS